MACTNTVGLLSAFLERALSSPTNNGDGGSGVTIARSALTHLVGTGSVNLANYSTCRAGLPGWWHCSCIPVVGTITAAMAAGWSRAEEGQGTVGPAICAAGVPAAEMAWGLDLGLSVLEGSNIQENWAMEFGGALGGGSGNKAGEAEDILGAIAGSRGGSGSIASARGKRCWQSPERLPQSSPVLPASLARKEIARMSLSLLLSSLVGVSKPIIFSLNFLVLVLPFYFLLITQSHPCDDVYFFVHMTESNIE
jgi:hypothetical protein